MLVFATLSIAGMLAFFGSSVVSHALDGKPQAARVYLAQLNSPGDGLDPEAPSEGNGRTRGRAGVDAGRQNPANAGAARSARKTSAGARRKARPAI